MDKLTNEQFLQARNWVFRNARLLEVTRWKFHFEDGSGEDVINALATYQNDDGGFGNALEADSWNPGSSPFSTSTAVTILEEVRFREKSHPVVKGILHYLDNVHCFTGKYWPAVIPSNNDYPHAPWWTFSENFETEWGYTPTAKLAGFILRFADKDSNLYLKAERIAKEAVDKYLHGVSCDGTAYRSLHREGEVDSFHYLLHCLEEGGMPGSFDISELKIALKEQADRFMERDTSKWNQYGQKPSVFITSPESIFYKGNEDIMDAELSFILKNRNPDGVWNITWNWGAFEKEFAISENWWKATKCIEYMLLLKNFNRLSH